MDGFSAALARGFDHALDIEIAVARPRRPEQNGFIGHRDMQRATVGLRIDRNRAQAHRFRGADHATAISPRLAISRVRNRR